MNSGVYRIVCAKTGKCYIGSSVNLKYRLWRHTRDLRCGQSANNYMQRSWNKYGKESFEFQILEMCEKSIVRIREKELIDRIRPEFNARGTDPLKALGSHSEETRQKLSEARRRRVTTNETRRKLSLARRGRTPNIGHKHSEETKRKISISARGKPKTEAHKAAIAASKARRKKEKYIKP